MTGGVDPKDCPYVGLDPFEPAYEAYFFGRDQDSRVIADHVASRPITVLYGPSGVGKTSVLNVGVPAALRRRAPWLVVVVREWQNPGAIEAHATQALRAAMLAEGKAAGQAGFARSLAQARRNPKRRILLILDQFEEYFLYNPGNALSGLEQALTALVGRRSLGLHLLISLREDSLFRLDRLRVIAPGLLDTTLRLGHLDDAAVEDTILCPIARYNEVFGTQIKVEETLVAQLKKDLRGGGKGQSAEAAVTRTASPIELPYLQLVLTRLWNAEGGSKATSLRQETLTGKLGGVRQIANEHVDVILHGLPEREQVLCADIFRYLVTSGGSKVAYPTDGLARRISDDRREAGQESNLCEVDAGEVTAVLQKLTPTETRLLKPVKVNDADAFELFHDVLGEPVSAWRAAFRASVRLREENKRLQEQEARAKAGLRFITRVAAVIGAVAIVAILSGIVAYAEAVGAKEAVGRSYWGGLTFAKDDLDATEIDALWRIGSLRGHERDGFLAPLTGAFFDRGVLLRLVSAVDDILGPASLHIAVAPHIERGLMVRAGNRPKSLLRTLGLRPLSDQQLEAMTSKIIETLPNDGSDVDQNPLFALIGALPGRLSDRQADIVIDHISEPSDVDSTMFVIGEKLLALRKKLTTSQTQILSNHIWKMFEIQNGREILFNLSPYLGDFPWNFSTSQWQEIIHRICSKIDLSAKRNNRIRVLTLATSLHIPPIKLDDMEVQNALITALGSVGESDSYWSVEFVKQLPSSPGLVAPEILMRAFRSEAEKTAATADATYANGEILSALATKLSPDDAHAAYGYLMDGIPFAEGEQLYAFARALSPIVAKFNGSWSDTNLIVSDIEKTGKLDVFAALLRGIGSRGVPITDAQAQRTLAGIISFIAKTNGEFEQEALGSGLASVISIFDERQAQAAAEPIRQAMLHTDNPFALEGLGAGAKALAAVDPKLVFDGVDDAVVKIMGQTSDPLALGALAHALGAVPGGLSTEQANKATDSLERLSKPLIQSS